MEPIKNFEIESSNDIYKALVMIEQTCRLPSQGKLPDNYIFDEEKSVRWNREEVVRFNQDIQAAKREMADVKKYSLRNLDEAILDYLLVNGNAEMNRNVARLVLEKAKYLHDSEWWNYIEDYFDFAEEIIKKHEEQKC